MKELVVINSGSLCKDCPHNIVNGGRGCAFIDCIYDKYVTNLAKGKSQTILWLDKAVKEMKRKWTRNL
jgi:hypothetical protein